MIDPDEERSPQLEGAAAEAPPPRWRRPRTEAPAGGLQQWVAVLIMVVTLVGAIFAFLQTVASNRAARATRQSDIAAVEALASLGRGLDLVSRENAIWDLARADRVAAESLLAAGGETGALGRSLEASHLVLGEYTELARPEYRTAAGGADRAAFAQESLAPAYRAAEFQKAHAAERDGWGSKGGTFVVVITVLAVALFLIGLSRTPAAAASGALLLGAGSALAAVAAGWGLVVLARPVPAPSVAAIDAYVEGYVAFNSVFLDDDADRLRGQLARADEALTRAVSARPGYSDAYFVRGQARFRLGLYGLDGPAAFAGAQADFARVVGLQPLNAVAWNNLAAARFWTGELPGAVDAIRASLRLDPDDLLANINLAAFLLVAGDTAGYEGQMAAARQILEAGVIGPWELAYVAQEYHQVLGAAEAAPGADAALVRRLRADLEALLGLDL